MAANELKQWARENFKGVEDSLKSAFTPDFSDIDEDGVRHDVRHCIAQGYFAAMCSPNYTTLEERKRFVQLVCDEAKGRLHVGVNISTPKTDDRLDLMAHAERAGCDHAFLPYPRNLKPETEDEVFAYFSDFAEQTSMALFLYGAPSPSVRHLHPSGILVDVMDRVADLPNVVGIKFTQPINIGAAFELAERLSDRLLIGPANLELIPLLAKSYNAQWIGQWVVDSLQSPDKPYLVEFMNLINRGKTSEAMKIFWHLMPAYKYVHNLQEEFLHRGSHPWAHINFYHWCTGGNGGLPRGSDDPDDYIATLDAAGRQAIRDRYREIGIEPYDGPDEEFAVGKSAYGRGVRLADLTKIPQYDPDPG